eukprot:Rmarinus@m.8999
MCIEEINDGYTLLVKWSGAEYTLLLDGDAVVGDIKAKLEIETNVLVKRQKLMGLGPRQLPDSTPLASMKLKPSQKIMMMGTPEESIITEGDQDNSAVVNDLEDIETESIHVCQRVENLRKVEHRVKHYSLTIMNQPRPGKKLLVLDIDYTLFDHRSTVESIDQLRRPFLHEFLSSCYEHYDIMIWSATSMRWVELKMTELGVFFASFVPNHGAFRPRCNDYRAVREIRRCELQTPWGYLG